MRALDNADYYRRLSQGLLGYLDTPMDGAAELLREQLRHREARWLDLVRRGVFDAGDGVYSRLFAAAGCTYGDLERGVREDGLEPTLVRLRDAGVYLTHDEYKGFTPTVRANRTIAEGSPRFANPLVSGWLRTESSGSRGPATPTSHNTAQTIHRDAYWALHFQDLGLASRTSFPVRPVLPSAAGLVTVLAYARHGCPLGAWFAMGGTLTDSAHYRALTSSLVAIARVKGLGVPLPSYLPASDFSPVARAVASARARGEACAVPAVASTGVRIAAAAIDAGLDISGSVFVLSGESVTEAKRRHVEAAGVRVHTMYWISEIGPVGWGCSQMHDGDAVHLLEDSIAVIPHRRIDPRTGLEFEPLLYTTLLPTASNLLINADMGDCARIERATCACAFHAAGFGRQVRDIWSYAKLSGQGMTLAGTEIVHLLEDTLPRRFGGGPGDFQLVEEEGSGGTSMVLRVSPRVRPAAPDDIRRAFLDALRSFRGGALASRVWTHTAALTVTRAEPATTGAGKVLPLHLLGAGGLREATKPRVPSV